MSLSTVNDEIHPLFVELNVLNKNDANEYIHWKERARWIRFEEQAEDVLGRWSKPHVSTIPNTAIDDLKDLAQNGIILLDMVLTNVKEISDIMANELLDYFDDFSHARVFAEIMCLPIIFHHDKKLKAATSSSVNLMGTMENINQSDFEIDQTAHDDADTNNLSKSHLKYRYSFSDTIMIDEFRRIQDFKENAKFKKKVHRKAEGAGVFVMPVDFVNTSRLIFLRLESATDLQSFFEVKIRTKFIILVIGPSDRQTQLFEIGRAVSTCLADDVCRELFYTAKNKDDIIEAFSQFSRGTMAIPVSEWNPKIRIEPPEKYLSKEDRKRNPELADYLHGHEIHLESHNENDPTLKSSLKPFLGLYTDLKRKIPFFVSDFTDSLNLQCLASTLYIYLVTLCSLVAFGGLFGQKSDNYIATMECILAGSICGAIFSLFSGQPLNIISATGPVLILETIIKGMCDKYSIEFMEFRVWIGFWVALILFLLVMFNLSFLVKYITRFTEDCFATLVAIVFIIDAIKSVVKLKEYKVDKALLNGTVIITNQFENGSEILNATNLPPYLNMSSNYFKLEYLRAQHAISFYFSIIIFLLTYFICVSLKAFREKPYLPSKIRQVLSDFSVFIAIIVASLLDNYMSLSTLKLAIPSKFQPTRSDRDWIIPIYSGKNPWYTIFIAIIPALIATILIFMDQQITAVIANRKELKLKKSHGYHLDLIVVAITILVSSILGLPWFVAATVLTLTHINSLKVMSENTAPGEKPIFTGIREQRGTTFLMAIMIGLSIFLAKVLSYIPMAALYGVFMFMGTSALNGMIFYERILILFMPAKHQPDFQYLRFVKTRRVHLFTIIQLLSTASLYLIKLIDLIAISFPIMIVATCGIRKVLDYVFTQHELYWLDDILPGSSKKDTKKPHNHVNKPEETENFMKSDRRIHKIQSLTSQSNALTNSDNDLNNPGRLTKSNSSLDRGDTINQKTKSLTNLPVRFYTNFPDIQEVDDVKDYPNEDA